MQTLVILVTKRTHVPNFHPPGPKATEPGYASVCEAFGGFRHINGYADRCGSAAAAVAATAAPHLLPVGEDKVASPPTPAAWFGKVPLTVCPMHPCPRPPVRPNISLGDTLAGLHAAFGAVMALLHRQR